MMTLTVSAAPAIANAASDAGISGNSGAMTQAQDWLSDAQNYVASGFTAASDLQGASASGYNTVKVLGLYDTQADAIAAGSAGIHQCQLVEDSSAVPLPAAANLALAMLGGIALFRLTRRNAKLA